MQNRQETFFFEGKVIGILTVIIVINNLPIGMVEHKTFGKLLIAAFIEAA
ncbi:hypothetical protein VIJ_000151 [Vibrio cholerae RC27]|nr:hypothetical protein VIJ_000151 [Vibrio cholerae RC27]